VIPQELIRAKRDGQELTEAQIRAFFEGYLVGSVADYQVSAMLMAIVFRGMSRKETATLTRIMRDSGRVLSWPYETSRIVDKHSTGGVGDKTSLVLLPLCTLEGVVMPMIAGRGLGHTGGTLDKLEAIPGMNVFPSIELTRSLIDRFGGAFMGQTDEVAALDRRLYALRDVTATVESIPLIVSSILSKKLAEGIGGLVMDVKFGSGAFFAEADSARVLARTIVDVGKEAGLQATCVLSSMNSPLGTNAGNALEVWECVEIMQGRGPADTRELVVELALDIIRTAFPSESDEAVRSRISRRLLDGSVFEQFCRIVSAQGGDTSVLAQPMKMCETKIVRPVFAGTRGAYVESVDVRRLGVAVQMLGGGRRMATDLVDPAVGLSGLLRIGAGVGDQPVAIIHANSEESAREAEFLVKEAYVVGDQKCADPLILERLR